MVGGICIIRVGTVDPFQGIGQVVPIYVIVKVVFDSVSVQIFDHITHTDGKILLIAGSRIILHADAEVVGLHRFIIKLSNGLECSVAFEKEELIGRIARRQSPLVTEVVFHCPAVGISKGGSVNK